MQGDAMHDEKQTTQIYAEPILFGRERRLHARALDFWTSMLHGRTMPALADLDPQALAPFAANSLLIRMPDAPPGPSVAFVGRELRDEAGLDVEQPLLGDIPSGSLLSELLRRYPEIVGHRAPLRFEAEFVGRTGQPTAYRGILLPFSADGRRIEAVYGIISWRLLANVGESPDIAAAVGNALTGRPIARPAMPWGATGGYAPPPQALDQRIAAARTWAALAAGNRGGGRSSFHAALGAAYDLFLGTSDQSDAFDPATAIDVVFGDTLPRREKIRCLAVLSHATRLGIGPSLLGRMLDAQEGGYAAFVSAERRARRAGLQARPVAAVELVSGELSLTPINGAAPGVQRARSAA
jgi:hypothetical protein